MDREEDIRQEDIRHEENSRIKTLKHELLVYVLISTMAEIVMIMLLSEIIHRTNKHKADYWLSVYFINFVTVIYIMMIINYYKIYKNGVQHIRSDYSTPTIVPEDNNIASSIV